MKIEAYFNGAFSTRGSMDDLINEMDNARDLILDAPCDYCGLFKATQAEGHYDDVNGSFYFGLCDTCECLPQDVVLKKIKELPFEG